MPSRRTVASAALGLALTPLVGRRGLAADGVPLAPGLAAGVAEEAVMDALPGKRPLIKLSYRPPNYETPLDYFREPITPNDASSSATTTRTSPRSTPASGACGWAATRRRSPWRSGSTS